MNARCMALTKAGDQCRSRHVKGADYCAAHGGTPRKIGRPTKLNDRVTEAIVAIVTTGTPIEPACRAVGIAESTFQSWRERGEADVEAGTDTVFARFVEALYTARAGGEVNLVELVNRHAIVDWRAAAWLLERRYPQRYGRRDHVEHSGSVNTGAPVVVEATDDAALAVARILADADAVKAPE